MYLVEFFSKKEKMNFPIFLFKKNKNRLSNVNVPKNSAPGWRLESH
jgi:hypothetical protein